MNTITALLLCLSQYTLAANFLHVKLIPYDKCMGNPAIIDSILVGECKTTGSLVGGSTISSKVIKCGIGSNEKNQFIAYTDDNCTNGGESHIFLNNYCHSSPSGDQSVQFTCTSTDNGGNSIEPKLIVSVLLILTVLKMI